jgi:hypothetical protein
MKTRRVWFEIVILGTTIACVLALVIATLGAAAGAAVGELGPQPATQASVEQPQRLQPSTSGPSRSFSKEVC